MLRSFQRLATCFIFWSVKTAPTEALLVLAKLLLLDLQLLKTTGLRDMANTSDIRFTPSSLKVLFNLLPLAFSTPKFQHASMVSLPDHPPSSNGIWIWEFPPCRIIDSPCFHQFPLLSGWLLARFTRVVSLVLLWLCKTRNKFETLSAEVCPLLPSFVWSFAWPLRKPWTLLTAIGSGFSTLKFFYQENTFHLCFSHVKRSYRQSLSFFLKCFALAPPCIFLSLPVTIKQACR